MIEETSLFRYDEQLRREGYLSLCGVDEAGRGPLAGPVVAAAVILPEDALQRCPQLAVLNDSKKLSEKKREALFEPVKATALGFGIGQASWEEIDQLNILQATFLAMRRAVEQMEQQFHLTPDLVLVDGNRDPHLGLQTRTVVKGDGTSACIAAASILAKVTETIRWSSWIASIRSMALPSIRATRPNSTTPASSSMESARCTAGAF